MASSPSKVASQTHLVLEKADADTPLVVAISEKVKDALHLG